MNFFSNFNLSSKPFALSLALFVITTTGAFASPVDSGSAIPPSAPRPFATKSESRETPPVIHPATAGATIPLTVTFYDPNSTYAAYHAPITACLQAAMAQWAHYLKDSGPLSIVVDLTQAPSGRVNTASATSAFVHVNGARNVYEQGATANLRTGTDQNGATPDINMAIDPGYLTGNLWFDPDPNARTASIPANRTDAISVFTHELGHAFVFSGWMNQTNGTLPDTYMSTFDEQSSFDGANFFFNGATARDLYGGPVPLTYGNIFHIANNSPRPGSDLLNDLMNGVVYYYQTRYYISGLDLSIARDAGVDVILGGELANISTRLQVGSGDNLAIAGFIVTGTGPKKVLIRGIGPSLAKYGVPNVLTDPVLELDNSDRTAIATNNNWRDTQGSDIAASGLAPTDDAESAILISLQPGAYTALLRGVNDGTGNGSIEVYEVDSAAPAVLGNISSRGFVGTNDNVMIGGLIVSASGVGKGTVVIRALGPSLAKAGVNGALTDPFLELHDSQGNPITTNDNWQDTQAAEITAAGFAPGDPHDAVILARLAPGAYTAVVRGVNNSTGIALVEAYNQH